MAVRFSVDRNHLRYLTLAVFGFALSACSSGGSSSGSSSASTLSVSGSLTQLTAASADPVSMFEANFSTTGTKLSLDCGAAGTFSATVDPSTGAFSASGVPAGVPCSFNFTSSTTGATKCQVQFQDSSSYDLNNNPMSTSSATASTSVALGSITCDTSGNVTIPSSGVSGISSGASVSAATAFDFTGTWTAAAYDGTLPAGYQTATNCTSNCNGPSIGDPISLVRFMAKNLLPTVDNVLHRSTLFALLQVELSTQRKMVTASRSGAAITLTVSELAEQTLVSPETKLVHLRI